MGKTNALPIVITVLFCALAADGANIVFFFGVSSYSHRVPAWPLAESLAENGHNVTFISPFPAKNPNPKIFDYVPRTLKEWSDTWGDLEDPYEDRKNGETLKGWYILPTFGIMMCEEIYKDQDYINWVKSSQVDLVFLDALSNDCAYGMADYWGAKVVIFQTTNAFSWFTDSFGLPDETNWIPNMETAFPADMSFTQRIINKMTPIFWDLYRKWYYFPKLEEITREKLWDGKAKVPKFEDLERNTTMVFLNTEFSEGFARSLPSHTIAVGGIALTGKRKTLPKDLDNFLSKGSGFIYMSFGTYGDFLRMDRNIQEAFIGAMNNSPNLQFVFKVANDSLIHEFPHKNVYISKWMPQQDILAHPKIKAFITHSGLLGIQEAIYNGVPLISFPIFAEQDFNAERIHRNQIGIRLEITTVKKSELTDAITKITTDAKYRENMKRISVLFKDKPQKPLDTALWWTDYVLRHSREELSALRPLGIHQPWWKKRGLDVWATVLGISMVVLILTVCLSFKLLKLCFKKSKVGEKTKDKMH